MEIEALSSTHAPWLHIFVGSQSDAWNTMLHLLAERPFQVTCRWLRGQKMNTVDGLFDEFAAALQFPYYFGNNWPAFDECLADLEWLPADGYVTFVSHATSVLENAAVEDLRVLVRILHQVAREWNEGETSHSGSPRPFHVVFQCSAEEENQLRRRLELAGAYLT